MVWRITGARLEANHGFIRLGIAKGSAHKSFDGLGIISQCSDFSLELAGNLSLLLNFGIQPENLLSHPFVLLDKRQITEAEQNHNRHHDQGDHRLGQPVPDAEVNFHTES